MKDYGMEHPQLSFLDRHGKRLGAAAMTICATVVFGIIIWSAIILSPSAIEQMQDRSSELVSISTGGDMR